MNLLSTPQNHAAPEVALMVIINGNEMKTDSGSVVFNRFMNETRNLSLHFERNKKFELDVPHRNWFVYYT